MSAVPRVLATLPVGPVPAFSAAYAALIDENFDWLSINPATSVKNYGAVGDGTTPDQAAFTACDAANASIYVPAGVYLFTANTVLAHQVILNQGAVLKPASGVTITMNGAVAAGLWQIFDLSAGGSVILNDVGYVQARWFGASPGASASTNVIAINQAITCAKASQNANVMLGPGTLSINGTLNYGTANRGITTIGIYDGSMTQGSVPGVSTLSWTGGALPMIETTQSFHTFHGFNLQNFGTATHGIRGIGGYLWVNRVKFGQPSGSVAFSTASIEIYNGINYDRISLCQFETGPSILVSAGLGTTLLVDQNIFDSTVGSSGSHFDIRGNVGEIMVRENTVNFKVEMPTFIDMTHIGSYAVGAFSVVANEFAGSAGAQLYIARLKNCGMFRLESSWVNTFSDPLNVESPITAINSRVVVRDCAGLDAIRQPLVHTLDSTSFAYVYENSLDLGNTQGVLTADSQSGNYIPALVGVGTVKIQGDRSSPMAPSAYLADITSSGTTEVSIGKPSDSSDPSFMTVGQVFTILFKNSAGSPINAIVWDSPAFTLANPMPAPPLPGNYMSITFIWDGMTARELHREYDPWPTWVPKTATGSLTWGEVRVQADAAAGDITLTMPRADSLKSGFRYLFKKVTAANNVIINSTAGFTIDGAASYTLTAQWSFVEVESDGTQWLIVSTGP